MPTRTAACSCGQLKVEVDAEPIRVSMCHCHACQRRTGSVFGAQARFARDACRIEGRSTTWKRVGDSGITISFHFCPECGATVYYELDVVLDAIVIPIGAFADSTFPSPRFSVYEARMHSWVGLPSDVEHHD